MRNRFEIVLGASLIVAGLAVAPAATGAVGSAPLAQDAEPIVDGEGEIQPEDQAQCGGTAPLETECTTGTWTIGAGSYGHGILASDRYPTYTLESRMVHDTGEDRILRCSFVAGEVQSCETGGDWPAFGAEFEHVCTVTWPSPLPEDQGGLPDWACLVVASPA